MLKILILSHGFSPDVGGIETNSEILAAAFRESGAEVHVVTWTKANGSNDFPFTVIRDPGLAAIFKEHRWADVILENNPCLRLSWPNLFIRKPLVVALNTWVSRIKGNKAMRDKLKWLWFRRSGNVIAVSEAVRIKEWPGAAVIENPYNDRLFTVKPGLTRTIPFVFLGRLVSDKGADQAIRAVSMLIDEGVLDGNSTQLTIIGEGPEKQNLEALVKKLDVEKAVQLTGVLKGGQLVECLNRHRFMLVPSWWQEPYGNVVLEGLACGCIPIASNGGGLPEAVGKAGVLFKRNDVADMVKVIKSVIDDETRLEALQANAGTHLAEHSVKLVSEKYFSILKQAACKE